MKTFEFEVADLVEIYWSVKINAETKEEAEELLKEGDGEYEEIIQKTVESIIHIKFIGETNE